MHVDRIEGHSFIRDALGSDSVVVDLGMNSGGFSVVVAEKLGCRVVAVEPDERVLDGLPEGAPIELERVAIAGRDGTATIFRPEGNDATVLPELARGENKGVEVPALSLGTLFTRRGLDRVDLLKIDIEGAEIDVVLSTPEKLLCSVKQITIEFHDWLNPRLAGGTRAVDRRLRELGFRRLAFSRNTSDVLYVNESALPLSLVTRMLLLLRFKYGRGLSRRIGGLVP